MNTGHILFWALLLTSFYSNAALICGNNRFQDRNYASMMESAEDACSHQNGATRVGNLNYLSGNIALVQCESQNGTGGWEPWLGFTISCKGDEFYPDLTNAETENDSNGKSCPSSSNPINLMTGNKYKIHTDLKAFVGILPRPGFARTYNSQSPSHTISLMGVNWRHTYQRSIDVQDSFRTGIHLRTASGGEADNQLQGSIYGTEQQACTEGFHELVERLTTNPPNSVFAGSRSILQGRPLWTGSRCRVFLNGRYIATIPIKSVKGGISRAPVAQYKIKLLRPDGKEHFFKKDITLQGELQWKSATPGLKAKLEQIPVDGLTAEILENPAFHSQSINSVYRYTDENDVVEVYDQQGKLLSIEYTNGVIDTLTHIYIDTLEYTGYQLTRVENNYGKYIDFDYYLDGKIETVTDEAGRRWSYEYDLEHRLVKVVNPDATEKNYHYENASLSNALTGLTDERAVRFSTFTYYADDVAHGLAKSSYLGSPYAPANEQMSLVNVNYLFGLSRNTVSDSRGNTATYRLPRSRDTDNGRGVTNGLVVAIEGPSCATCGENDIFYDWGELWEPENAAVDLESKTEYGITTRYNNYDAKGNPESITEAAGTPEERKKKYTYDPRFNSKISTVTESSIFSGNNKITTYTYDDYGNATSVTLNGFKPDGTTISRTTTLQYEGPFHQLSQINGPRSDVNDIVAFDYYPNEAVQGNNRARLRSVSTHDGILLRDAIQYTETGQIDNEVRVNGLHIDYTYYPGNDRLHETIQTDTAASIARTTRWTYLATGEVKTITEGADSPHATTLTLGYDDARRLTRITDNLGNYIEYVLDSEGNVEQENIHDVTDELKKTLSQTFDAYNRQDNYSEENQVVNYDYHADGTLNQTTDGKDVITAYSYDDLKRLTRITRDQGGTNPSTTDVLIQYGYDVQDNLTSVTDANGNPTTYVYDDLGNLLSMSSPDTGVTVFTHDAAGNVLTKQDAKGQLFIYTYDAYNRLELIDVAGIDHDITYVYDSCTQGQFRLCSVTYGAESPVTYQYNAFGDISHHQGLIYAYDDAGRTRSITYPSGNIVTYHYDTAGQIERLELNQGGVSSNLAHTVRYSPFGEVSQLIYGNGLDLNYDVDTAYRPFNITIPNILNLSYQGYDANGNLLYLDDSQDDNAYQYEYDEFNRVTRSRQTSNSSTYGNSDVSYGYDKNGNRTKINWTGSDLIYIVDPGSNWIPQSQPGSVVYDKDSNGNRILHRTRSYYWHEDDGDGYNVNDTIYAYTPHNRLASAHSQYTNEDTLGSIKFQTTPASIGEYAYNGLGQRTWKRDDQKINHARVPDVESHFSYGRSGELLFENNSLGVVNEYIYLNNKLIALIRNNQVYYVHTDHLGAVRAITDASGSLMWHQYHKEAFRGVVDVVEYMDSSGDYFSFNLRFPGQYYDWETQFFYNYFRYYDPQTGRYISSDPIGLAGGINTYSYVSNNPLKYIDPTGLLEMEIVLPGINKLFKRDPYTINLNGKDYTIDPLDPNQIRIFEDLKGKLKVEHDKISLNLNLADSKDFKLDFNLSSEDGNIKGGMSCRF